MARKDDEGRFTLSAGEIGAYTVCPEAWRLKAIERAKSIRSESVVAGHQLHEEWVTKFEEAAYLNHRVRLVAALLAIAAIIYAIIGGVY